MENWQSEYLQFTLMILLTVWLLQRGSPESKELDQGGRESDQEQKVGAYAQQNSPRWAKVERHQADPLRELARARDGNDLARHLVRAVRHRGRAVQQRPARPPPVTRSAGRTTSASRDFWNEDAAELAVRVPRGRLDGDPRRLPAPARLARVQAGRRAAHLHGRRRGLRRARAYCPGRRPNVRERGVGLALDGEVAEGDDPDWAAALTTGSRRMSCSRIFGAPRPRSRRLDRPGPSCDVDTESTGRRGPRPRPHDDVAVVTMPFTSPLSTTITSPMSASSSRGRHRRWCRTRSPCGVAGHDLFDCLSCRRIPGRLSYPSGRRQSNRADVASRQTASSGPTVKTTGRFEMTVALAPPRPMRVPAAHAGTDAREPSACFSCATTSTATSPRARSSASASCRSPATSRFATRTPTSRSTTSCRSRASA